MSAYAEPEKSIVRNESLKLAIETLTEDRHNGAIAGSTYVRKVRNYLIANGSEWDKSLAMKLDDSEIERWESFHESIIGSKKPRDLRVAYLSGPNPENDIEVLVQHGILPENIWAFESDNKTYSNAVVSALNSKYPNTKIYKGKIETYLKMLSFKFDLIYLDFCGTILSNTTVSVVRDIFVNQNLNTLGVLVTNFGLPSKRHSGNKKIRREINNLCANYLYPKPYTEEYTHLGGGAIESADTQGLTKREFVMIARKNIRTFYSQFITRLLFDLPSVIIPYQKLAANESLHKLFFKKYNSESFDTNYEETVYEFPDQHSLVWGLSKSIITDQTFEDIQERFNRQLSINSQSKFLKESIEKACYFMEEGLDDNLLSDKLQHISKNWEAFEKHVFCDVFLFHQLKDILIGQLTSPYFYNVGRTKRWVYTAKETDMFVDLITYDQCRYIFDWMPTVDMFESSVNDIDRQLPLRFAMDSIAKQRRWYNDEFFAGTAIVDQNTPGFRVKELKRRKQIKVKSK